MSDRRRPYRVTNRHGQTFDLLLTEETQKKNYPKAVPLKIGTPMVKGTADSGVVTDELPADPPVKKPGK